MQNNNNLFLHQFSMKSKMNNVVYLKKFRRSHKLYQKSKNNNNLRLFKQKLLKKMKKNQHFNKIIQ